MIFMNKLTAYYLFFIFISLVSCEKQNPNNLKQVDIIEFSVWDHKNVNHELYIDPSKAEIYNRQEIPPYVNTSRLIVDFKINNKDAVLKIDDKEQFSGKGEQSFTKEVIYDLYFSNEKIKSYRVNISKENLTNNFSTFSFLETKMENYQPIIDIELASIYNESSIPLNIDITSLRPEFTTVEKNAIVKVNGISQVSGKARHDFSKPVTYTIEGEDGTSKTFVVELNQDNNIYLENPIITGSYADPTVIRVGDMFYLYVTGGIVRGYKSKDLINWSRISSSNNTSEVFKNRPDFTDDNVSETGMWAPDINYYNGKYVMYYSISKWGGGATCGIGVGVSDIAEGPFLPPAGNPNGKLFVSSEIGVHNSIDPCYFEENEKRYIFWGSWNGIHMTELTSDGMAVKDLSNKKKIAGDSFEAAYIHKRNEYYYLFASVGACCEGMDSSYKVVVGRASKLEGPYLDKNGVDMLNYDVWNPSSYRPIVISGDETFAGPGHNSRIITDDNGSDWMLYHSYIAGESSRSLLLDKIEWDDLGWPFVNDGRPTYYLKDTPVFNN